MSTSSSRRAVKELKVWTGGCRTSHRLGQKRPPIRVHLEGRASTSAVRQYPVSKEARDGSNPTFSASSNWRSCRNASPCGMSAFSQFRGLGPMTVDPFRTSGVNKRVTGLYPVVPNPCNLLSSLPPSRDWYTVLDLKDAFCLSLATKSQKSLNGKAIFGHDRPTHLDSPTTRLQELPHHL